MPRFSLHSEHLKKISQLLSVAVSLPSASLGMVEQNSLAEERIHTP